MRITRGGLPKNNWQESAEAIASLEKKIRTKGRTENESSKDCNFGEEKGADNDGIKTISRDRR